LKATFVGLVTLAYENGENKQTQTKLSKCDVNIRLDVFQRAQKTFARNPIEPPLAYLDGE
jgi:hypothetical protein